LPKAVCSLKDSGPTVVGPLSYFVQQPAAFSGSTGFWQPKATNIFFHLSLAIKNVLCLQTEKFDICVY
jgi:hypothetical protein